MVALAGKSGGPGVRGDSAALPVRTAATGGSRGSDPSPALTLAGRQSAALAVILRHATCRPPPAAQGGPLRVECAFEGGPATVEVHAAAPKTVARMREKLAEYAPPHPRAVWPLSANILDPVRLSVVCHGAAQILEVPPLRPLRFFKGPGPADLCRANVAFRFIHTVAGEGPEATARHRPDVSRVLIQDNSAPPLQRWTPSRPPQP